MPRGLWNMVIPSPGDAGASRSSSSSMGSRSRAAPKSGVRSPHWLIRSSRVGLRQRGRRRRDRRARQTLRSMFRSPIEQLLRLAIPDYVGTVRHLAWPFSESAPRFPEYLRGERGLRWPTVQRYADHLRALERYLAKTGIAKLSDLTPRIITEFLTTRARQIHAPPTRRLRKRLAGFSTLSAPRSGFCPRI